MNPTLRALALGTLAAAIGVTAILAFPASAQNDGTDTWDVVELHRRISAAQQDECRIDREQELARRRIEIKQDVIRDLLTGRMTFEEAAARFAEVNATHASAVRYIRLTYPGKTDEDRAARQLARHLRLSDDPRAQSLGEEWECVLTARE